MAIRTLSSWSPSIVVERTNEVGRAYYTLPSKPLRLLAASALPIFTSSLSPTQGPIFHEGTTTIGHSRLGRWEQIQIEHWRMRLGTVADPLFFVNH